MEIQTTIQTRRHAETIAFIALAIALGFLCFAMPLIIRTFNPQSFFAQNHQFFVGPAVNTALVLAAIKVRGHTKILSIVLLPSISSIVLGLWFAVGSQFMLYMIPAIWLGNMALVLAFKLLYNRGIKNSEPKQLPKNSTLTAKIKYIELRFMIASIIGIGAKVGVIFGIYAILRAFGVFPPPVASAMWTVMGVNQLITATIGCVIAYGVVKSIQLMKQDKPQINQ